MKANNIIIVLVIAILGFLPGVSMTIRTNKFILAEWAIMTLITLYYVRSFWLKMFVLWAIIRTILCAVEIQYTKFSLMTLHLVFFYALYYQFVMDNAREIINKVFNAVAIITLLNLFIMLLQYCGFWFVIRPIGDFVSLKQYYEGWINIAEPAKYSLYGLMSNTNMTSSSLLLGLPTFFRAKWRWGIPFVWAGLVATHSLGGTLPALIITLLYVIWKYRKNGVIFALILLSAAIFYIARSETSIDLRTGSSRFPVWKETITQVLPLKPYMGWGLGHFKKLFPVIHKYGIKSEYANVQWLQAHNDYLQVAIELGIVGFLLVVIYLAAVFRQIRLDNEISLVVALGAIAGCLNAGGNFLMHTSAGILLVTYLAFMEGYKKEERNYEL